MTATAELHSPFLASSAQGGLDAHETDSLDQKPVREDLSDGLQIFRRASSWLMPSYTRKDCRCGQCSIGDPEPCPYARPQSQSSISSMLTTGRRSLSRLLSACDQTLRAAKDT